MKYFIGRVVINDHDSNREYSSDACIAAKTDAQAQRLLDDRAALWGGDDARKDNSGGYVYNESDGEGYTVFPYSLREITPATFAEMSGILPTFLEDDAGELAEQTLSEQTKTLARRLGTQLLKLDVKVPHGKLLTATAASLGETDWQKLKHKAVQTGDAVGADPLVARIVDAAVEWYGSSYKTDPAHRLNMAILAFKERNEGSEGAPSWFPRGNPFTGAMRNADEIEFSARVDAIWLTEGDVVEAAKLLRVTPDSLMGSFKEAMAADVAFCSRPNDWLPEHSLARDFGIKSEEGQSFTVEVKANGNYRQVTGRIGTKDVVHISNTIAGVWGVGGSSTIPYNFHEAKKHLACYEAAFRKVFELMSSMPVLDEKSFYS